MSKFIPTAEQLAEVEAAGGTKEISISAEGATVANVPLPTVAERVEIEVEQRIEEADLSRAQRRMRARRAKRPDIVQPVEIQEDGESETWYLTAMSDADIASIGILMASDGFTTQTLTTQEQQRSFFAAILCVGIVVSETDTTKFFESFDEAKEFYDDPRNAGTSVALRGQLMEMNPFFFGVKKNGPTMRLLPKNGANLNR